jgi:hypothetical protein
LDASDAERVLKILQTTRATGRKSTISHVKGKLGWTWTRTKNILLELAAHDRINAEETTYGWIFWPKEELAAPVPTQAGAG